MTDKPGKPITASVPSISVRFNASDGDRESLYFSEGESWSESGVKSSSDSQKVSSKAESSPLKEYFSKFSERSSDTSSCDASPTQHRYSLADFVEKVTKIFDTKSGSVSPESETRKNAELYSDSDDNTESSISKTTGLISTTDEVEMSSEDDVSEIGGKEGIEKAADVPEKKTLKSRFRFLKGNKPVASVTSPSPVKTLQALYKDDCPRVEITHAEDIEDAEEVCEEKICSNLSASSISSVAQTRQSRHSKSQQSTAISLPKSKYFTTDHATNEWVFTWRGTAAMLSFLMLFLALPISSTLRGFIYGILIATLCSYLYVKIFILTSNGSKAPNIAPSFIEILPAKEYQPITKFEGWVNEYTSLYHPQTYHVRKTASVYLKLEGKLLRFSYTRNKIPKRAMWNEPKHNVVFNRQIMYDLTGAKIVLVPAGLVSKRLWSKKYPICIIFKKPPQLVKEDSSPDNRLSSVTPSSSASSKERLLDESLDDNDTESIMDMRSFDIQKELLPLTDEFVADGKGIENAVFIFSRTGRDKETWFRKLVLATFYDDDSSPQDQEEGETSSVKSDKAGESNMKTLTAHYNAFVKFMMKSVPEPSVEFKDGKYGINCTMNWLNILIGRVFYDWCRNSAFVSKAQEKIQLKLSAIKLPYLIEELVVSELNIGSAPPIVQNSSNPTFDDRGMWLEFDFTYSGSVSAVITTKLNVMKLKNRVEPQPQLLIGKDKLAIYNSEVEDSAETSTEEEWYRYEPDVSQQSSTSSGQPTGKKFMQFVDRITASNFFQQATEYKYVKRAMEGVSRLDLKLAVEVKSLSGILVMNIPPPPSNRLWVGFRSNPNLLLTAKPIVGETSININHISNWIERKLYEEFQKVLVLPNMEDFIVPAMSPDLPS